MGKHLMFLRLRSTSKNDRATEHVLRLDVKAGRYTVQFFRGPSYKYYDGYESRMKRTVLCTGACPASASRCFDDYARKLLKRKNYDVIEKYITEGWQSVSLADETTQQKVQEHEQKQATLFDMLGSKGQAESTTRAQMVDF